MGLGEVRVTCRLTDVLLVNGLGSGIALCARDPAARVCGMAHIVLPSAGGNAADGEGPNPEPARYADAAVPYLLDAMERQGARTERLEIALIGGARLWAGPGGARLDVANRSTVAVLRALEARQLRLNAHDIGGAWGRACRLEARDGRVFVRTIGAEERELTVLGAAGGAR